LTLRIWSVHDKCMAVKTITIDMEAYELLSRHKRGGLSFSEVIKKHFGSQPTAARFRELLKSARLSEATLDAVDQQVAARQKERARAARR
jgi:predicted CopG family antitoxin